MSEESSIKTFDVDFYLIVRYFFVLNVLIIVGFSIFKTEISSILFFVVLVSAYYLGALVLSGFPIQIIINHRKKELTMTKLRYFKKTVKSLSLTETTCTYKREVIAKGGKVMTLKIFNKKGDLFLKITPDFSGWSEQKLSLLHKNLTNLDD